MNCRIWLLLAALGVLATAPGAADGRPLEVVTTVSDLADLVRVVGGDRVRVTSLADGYQDPHYLEAKPSHARRLRNADLLVYVGLDLETAWLPRLLETARNPHLKPGTGRLVDASRSVDRILEVHGHTDRSEGHVHPEGNPHYLLDPRNGLAVARDLAGALSALDPAGADTYQANEAAFCNHLTERIHQWEHVAADLGFRRVVTFHKQWEYLADWLGWEISGYVENRPGIPPSPRHVESLIRNIKEGRIPLVLAATYVDTEAAAQIARRAGARVVVLPAGVGGVEEASSYEAMFATILRRVSGES